MSIVGSDLECQRKLTPLLQLRDEFPVDGFGRRVGTDHDRAIVDVLAGSPNRTAVAGEAEFGIPPAGDRLAVGVGRNGGRDYGGGLFGGGDERVRKVGRNAVGVDAENTVAGGRQPVVARHLERA